MEHIIKYLDERLFLLKLKSPASSENIYLRMTDKNKPPEKPSKSDQDKMDEVLKSLLNMPPQPHKKKTKKSVK